MKYKQNKYNIEDIKTAINEWNNSNMSWKEVSNKYKIKMSTLKYHYYEKNNNNSTDNSVKNLKITNQVNNDMYKYVVPRTDKIEIENNLKLKLNDKSAPKPKVNKKQIRLNLNDIFDPKTGNIKI